jgi:hypothetical protein
VETVSAPEDWSGDQQLAIGYRNPLKRQTQDNVVRGAPKGPTLEKRCQMQGPRPKRVVMFMKQEDTQQAYCRAVDCKVNSRVCHWTAENKRLDTVKELASCKRRDYGWPKCWRCRSTGHFVSSVPTDRKNKWRYVYKLLGPSRLKGGAMWHVRWKLT